MPAKPNDDTESLRQLRTMTRITLAALAGSGVVFLATAQLIRVGGPTYQRISLGNELTADILPPPQYLVESQLWVEDLALHPNDADRERDIASLRQLHIDYDARHEYWMENLTGDAERRLLLDRAHQAATEFFRTVEDEYIPAVRAGDAAAVERLATGKLRDLYQEDRAVVDELVPLATTSVENAASRSNLFIVVGALVAAACLALIAAMVHRLGQRAAGALAESAMQSTQMEGVLREITDEAQSLSSNSSHLESIAQTMSSTADETTSQATVASAASEQVASTASDLAAAIAQMEASISEIARGAEGAVATTHEAVGIAEDTKQAIARLGTSSQEIGEVIEAIAAITADTNILALNASIEAARAGDAGKGFGVVANEVKELADQTAKATQDIRDRIARIRADAAASVTAMDQVTSVVSTINATQDQIAAAVSEQTTTARDMAGRVSEVARTTQEISSSIGALAQAAGSTSQGATETRAAAVSLSTSASHLKRVTARI